MQVTVERQDPCEVELKIEIGAEKVAQTIEKVYGEFSKTTSVPGFRKGKTPRAILERYVSPESVKRRAVEHMVPPAYSEAIKQENIEPYADPDFDDIGEVDAAQPFTFKAKVPLPPKVELGEYKGIKVERRKVKITDEEVDAQLKYLQESRATTEKVEDRGVQNGDIVIANISSALEGESMTEPKRSLVEVGNNIPGFDENIEGMKPGERKTFEATYPDDFSDKEMAGKKITFDVAVDTIRERRIPELNDEFAKTLGEFESVDALKSDLKTRMTEAAEKEADKEVEGKLVEEIVSRSTVNFPSVMVEHQLHHDLEEVDEELKKRKMTPEQYLAQLGKTEEEYISELRGSAGQGIKAGLALGEIAEKEQITVTDEEVDAEIDRIAAESNAPRESVESYMEAMGRGRSSLKNSLFNKKIMDFLKSVSTIK